MVVYLVLHSLNKFSNPEGRKTVPAGAFVRSAVVNVTCLPFSSSLNLSQQFMHERAAFAELGLEETAQIMPWGD